MRSLLISIVIAQFCVPGSAAQSLASRVLVVYNGSHPDSVSVAQHYATVRAIPAANLCAVNPPKVTSLTWEEFDTSVRQPVQACLNAVGRQSILYIVLSSQTPYKIVIPHPFSVDSALADIWDQYATVFTETRDLPTRFHPYYAPAQSLGNVYVPFQPFSSYRAQG